MEPTSPLADGLVRVKEVAEFMAVSRGMVYRLMSTGRLPFVRIGDDSRRIPMRSVVDYLNRNLQPARQPATHRMRTIQGERR